MGLSCIVLAGGKSSRLGRDKKYECIRDRSLLEWVINSLGGYFNEIIVVIGTNRPLPNLVSYPNLHLVSDIYSGKGPLGGIHAGLTASNSYHNLVLACDMPFLNHDLLHYMMELSPDFDLVVPRLGNKVEPLHAVYSKRCLAPAERLLAADKLSILELLSLLRVRYVADEEIDGFDPDHLSFFNINTDVDLQRARNLVEKNHARPSAVTLPVPARYSLLPCFPVELSK